MARPYIGVVGLTRIQDVMKTATMFNQVLCKYSYPIHIPQLGIQVTPRSIRGEKNQNRRLPTMEEIYPLFETALSVRKEIFTVIHLSPKDYSELNPIVDSLFEKIGGWVPETIKGLQLNGLLTRATPEQLARIRARYPGLKIIAQVHKLFLMDLPLSAMTHCFQKVAPYVDYYLIDTSGGTGTPLSVQLCARVAKELLDCCPEANVGFAGGLNGKTVAKALADLHSGMRAYGQRINFSIDAEGGLRDRVGEGYGNDVYNPKKAEAYFTNAVKTFQEIGENINKARL